MTSNPTKLTQNKETIKKFGNLSKPLALAIMIALSSCSKSDVKPDANSTEQNGNTNTGTNTNNEKVEVSNEQKTLINKFFTENLDVTENPERTMNPQLANMLKVNISRRGKSVDRKKMADIVNSTLKEKGMPQQIQIDENDIQYTNSIYGNQEHIFSTLGDYANSGVDLGALMSSEENKDNIIFQKLYQDIKYAARLEGIYNNKVIVIPITNKNNIPKNQIIKFSNGTYVVMFWVGGNISAGNSLLKVLNTLQQNNDGKFQQKGSAY